MLEAMLLDARPLECEAIRRTHIPDEVALITGAVEQGMVGRNR